MFKDHPLFTLENIFSAYRRCRKHKRNTVNAMKFEQNLEENLVSLHEELTTGSYRPGRSMAFLVEKPKRREIFAADFRDRVVHHILVGYLEPR
jgi:RNA-directed DNA polymerase